MCRAFQPFTMQGIYFSLKTSFQIKISPFHLSLLQSHHILREQKPRFAKKHFLLLYKLLGNLKKLYSTITLTIFFCFIKREKKFCFLGSKNRCFCFQGIGTPVRESDVRGRLSGSSLTSRLDITAIKL
jgi:hypothetical protein